MANYRLPFLDVPQSHHLAYLTGLGSGFVQAALSEPEVTMMVASGLLMTRRNRVAKGIGISFAMWVAARRVDQYVGVFDSKARELSRVIGESNQVRFNAPIS